MCVKNKTRCGRARSSLGDSSSDNNPVRLNMDEVLKGIGNVRLKKTARYQRSLLIDASAQASIGLSAITTSQFPLTWKTRRILC